MGADPIGGARRGQETRLRPPPHRRHRGRHMRAPRSRHHGPNARARV